MDWWEYVLIGVVVILTIVVIVGFVLLTKKLSKPTSALRNEDYAELGRLQTKMDNLETKIPDIVATTMGKAQAEYLQKQHDVQNQISEELRRQFQSISENVSSRLDSGFKTTNETFTAVNKQLGSIATTQASLSAVSGEVNSLRRVLEGNQSRGQFGEYTLEMIIRSVFGEDVKDVYAFQKPLDNPFGRNVRPDVTIYLPEPDKHLCIDSKFPFSSYKEMFDGDEFAKPLLTKFKGELQTHIRKIRDDYIIPGVTAPYALMFIPSDGIFAFVHINLFEVVEAAYRDNVIIVSPSTLQPMLATVNLLRLDRKRAERVQELNIKIDKLRVEFNKFNEVWSTFSKNVERTLQGIEDIDRRNRALTRFFNSIKEIDEQDNSTDIDADVELVE
ncbi:MAG TPA: hypothetical protein DCX17_01870 [Firmicutes bacterium]|nr:hypothetical protein [Bacillota bacterium]